MIDNGTANRLKQAFDAADDARNAKLNAAIDILDAEMGDDPQTVEAVRKFIDAMWAAF